MYVLGTRLREGQAGKELGIALAFAWVAFPYSTYVLESNSNDSLTAAFVVWTLVFMRSPVARGAAARARRAQRSSRRGRWRRCSARAVASDAGSSGSCSSSAS